jgi:hydrophobic/amphiphilic exporter-1 (mainly G- bacteria), HAE1 family
MLLGTIFGVIIIPGLYVVFATLGERFQKKEHQEEIEFDYKNEKP